MGLGDPPSSVKNPCRKRCTFDLRVLVLITGPHNLLNIARQHVLNKSLVSGHHLRLEALLIRLCRMLRLREEGCQCSLLAINRHFMEKKRRNELVSLFTNALLCTPVFHQLHQLVLSVATQVLHTQATEDGLKTSEVPNTKGG